MFSPVQEMLINVLHQHKATQLEAMYTYALKGHGKFNLVQMVHHDLLSQEGNVWIC